MAVTGPVAGLLAGLFGVGGGIVIRHAVATASAFGIVISVPATVIAITGGWGEPRMPPWSLSHVNLIGFAPIAPGSILAAPWGAQPAQTMSPLLLKRLFAPLLAVTSARMSWRGLA